MWYEGQNNVQEFLNYFRLGDPWNPRQGVSLGNKNFDLLNYLMGVKSS